MDGFASVGYCVSLVGVTLPYPFWIYGMWDFICALWKNMNWAVEMF